MVNVVPRALQGFCCGYIVRWILGKVCDAIRAMLRFTLRWKEEARSRGAEGRVTTGCTITTVTANIVGGWNADHLAETDTRGPINSTSNLPLQETVRSAVPLLLASHAMTG